MPHIDICGHAGTCCAEIAREHEMVMVASAVASAATGSTVHRCMSVVAVGISLWRRSLGSQLERDGLPEWDRLHELNMPTVTVVTNVDLVKEDAVKLVGSITECLYPIVGCPAGYVHVHGA
jgi:hypothetical protein